MLQDCQPLNPDLSGKREAYSLPRRLYSQATSSSTASQYPSASAYNPCGSMRGLQTIRPALLFFSSSFRRSSIFSSNVFPAKLSASVLTFSCGRGGRLSPHTASTRLMLTPTSAAPPFFFIFSSNLRASAAWRQNLVGGMEILASHTSCYNRWIHADGFLPLRLVCCPEQGQISRSYGH